MGEISREQIIEAARKYEGVAYAAGGMSRYPGLNCLGFVANTARDVGLISEQVFNEFKGKSNFTADETLDSVLAPFAVPLDDWHDAKPGDVLAIGSQGDPFHCGLCISYDGKNMYIIHASQNNGVEIRRYYGSLLKIVTGAYRWKAIAD